MIKSNRKIFKKSLAIQPGSCQQLWLMQKWKQEIAVKTGFTEKEARNEIAETLEKSLKLYYHSGFSSEEVMDLIPVKPIGDKKKLSRFWKIN